MFERRTALERVRAAWRIGMRVNESTRRTNRVGYLRRNIRIEFCVRIVVMLKLVK